jgi:erythromycin esterase
MKTLEEIFTPRMGQVDSLVEEVRSIARPLGSARDLDPLMERIGDARVVLLGEASHGTAEYYTWRAEISERLIQENGFSFIAVEGDWPDCYQVNCWVKGHGDGSPEEVLHCFDRWPTWMWANREVEELAGWLRDHNAHLPEERKVGFYGLDVYSLWESIRDVIQYLDRTDPEAADRAVWAARCFDPYAEDVQQYAAATRWVPTSCEDEVISILADLRRNAPRYQPLGRDAYFDAEQNALVAKNAELYYRTMVRGGAASWNVRDGHMSDTLDRLLAHHGSGSKAIVWEHNTHIGDARFTDMADDGMFNIGQLARDRHAAEGVVLVGFGSYRGSVIAGRAWDAPMQRMKVPPAREGSWEDVLHRAGAEDRLLLFEPERLSPAFLASRGHRAIGVVYNPDYERYGNYVPTVLPRRYDAFLYIDETEALHPLRMEAHNEHEVPETYPTGM